MSVVELGVYWYEKFEPASILRRCWHACLSLGRSSMAMVQPARLCCAFWCCSLCVLVLFLVCFFCAVCRGCDDLLMVAKLCAELGMAHVVNNAYGVQSAVIMKGTHSHRFALHTLCPNLCNAGLQVVVCVIKGCALMLSLSSSCGCAYRPFGPCNCLLFAPCSFDCRLPPWSRRRNPPKHGQKLHGPVGGAVLTAPAGKGRGWLVDAVAKAYPGRAAMTPQLGLLTTLLYWGAAGWMDKLQQREELFVYVR